MGDAAVVKKSNEDINPRQIIAKMAAAMGIEIDADEYAIEVVKRGDKVIVPTNVPLKEVIKALVAEDEAERQKVTVSTTVAVPPWDGAMAFYKAIAEETGLVQAKEIPGSWFSADKPPTELEVEYELGKTMTVRWGRFELPTLENALAETGISENETSGEMDFVAKITTVRKHQKRARKILDRMRDIAATESIHKGKAFSIQFYDADGDQIKIPTPKFFNFNRETPIFRADLEKAIDRNIYTPIRYAKQLQDLGESLKRGVLFAGKYGTGKTMLASAIASVASQHGWTFIYVKEPKELPLALKYAQKFQPVVVFAEDVDRVAGLARSNEVNNLLNQLDGVDSKSAQIMTILTSNHSSMVNAAMRRPGRIDMVLQVLPPDAETITRMVTSFVGTGLAPQAELGGIGETLTGFAPAYIKEACGRARLEALRRTGNIDALITGGDLTTVAEEVKAEKELFAVNQEDESSTKDHAELGALADGLGAASKIMKDSLKKAMGGQSAATTTTRQ